MPKMDSSFEWLLANRELLWGVTGGLGVGVLLGVGLTQVDGKYAAIQILGTVLGTAMSVAGALVVGTAIQERKRRDDVSLVERKRLDDALTEAIPLYRAIKNLLVALPSESTGASFRSFGQKDDSGQLRNRLGFVAAVQKKWDADLKGSIGRLGPDVAKFRPLLVAAMDELSAANGRLSSNAELEIGEDHFDRLMKFVRTFAQLIVEDLEAQWPKGELKSSTDPN